MAEKMQVTLSSGGICSKLSNTVTCKKMLTVLHPFYPDIMQMMMAVQLANRPTNLILKEAPCLLCSVT